MQATATDPAKSRHIDLILGQIDTLPTLPAIAARLLALTTSDESETREVIELISADQSLTSRVLSLCSQANLGVRGELVTVDKAVVLLGFNTIRNAVLSVKVVELFSHEDEPDRSCDGFDYLNFWRHSLAVAIASELIAGAHPDAADLPPGEAFVCGLVHDIGKLALDQLLPKSFERVIKLVDVNQGQIAEFERRIIGMDHHTAGKRLAEQWQLPAIIQDSIWLHGTSYETLPDLDHKRMIGLVSLADLVVRKQHIGYSGNFVFEQDQADLAESLGLNPGRIDHVIKDLHEQLEQRSRALGLDDTPSRELVMASIQQANQALGRLNIAMERRTRTASKRTQMLNTISTFHSSATPGRSVQDVLAAVVNNATEVFGPGYYAMLYQSDPNEPWLFCQYNDQSLTTNSRLIDPPPHSPDLLAIDASQPMLLDLMSLLAWVADYVVDAQDVRTLKLLALGCGWGTAAVMLHDRGSLADARTLGALTSTWGSAIASSAQHESARRLGEQLAEANRTLAETQDRLLHTQTMARLGELAAGAAHEMNNPLAVISGRSQLLAKSLETGSEPQRAAQSIVEKAHGLSNLITSLRMFADPPQANRRLSNVPSIVTESMEQARQQMPPKVQQQITIDLRLQNDLPHVSIDPDHIGGAVTELLLNAIQSAASSVCVSARIEPVENRLVVDVSDNGAGMDARTLEHAMDPFFSAKRAGRRVGMGLSKAQQWAAAHDGTIHLRSEAGRGTTATLSVPLDCQE